MLKIHKTRLFSRRPCFVSFIIGDSNRKVIPTSTFPPSTIQLALLLIHKMARITFLGMGNIGSAVTCELVKANNAVTAWNRTVSRPGVQAAVDAGATFEPSIEAAISRSDIVMICVLKYKTIIEMLAPLPRELFAGKTVVNFTTGSPGDASSMDAKVRDLGAARYFDGAIMVVPSLIGAPECTLVVSGESEDAYSDISGLLAPLGNARYLGAEIGAACRWDSAVLVQGSGLMAGMIIALSILRKGSPDGKVGPLIDGMVPLVNSLVPVLHMLAESWDAEKSREDDEDSTALFLEATETIKRTCEESGVDFGTLEGYLGKLKKAQELHGLDSTFADLAPLYRKD